MLWRHDGEFYPGTTCFFITPIVSAIGGFLGFGAADAGISAALGAAGTATAGAAGADAGILSALGAAGTATAGAAGVGLDSTSFLGLAGDAASAGGTGAAAGALDLGGTALDASTLAGTTPSGIVGGTAPITLNAGPPLAATPATGLTGAGASAAAGAPPGDIAAGTIPAAAGNTALPVSTDFGAAGLPTNLSDVATGGVNSFGNLAGTQAFDTAAGTIAPQSIGVGGGAASTIAPAATNGWQAIGNFINNPSLSGLGNLVSPSTALGAVGLGYDILKANQPIPNQGALSGQAAGLSAEGQALQQAELTGQLPTGAQASVNQAVQANQAAIRSRFADLGLSGSTMETEALNSAAQQGTALGFQIATQMASQGLSDEQLSSSIYAQLTNYQLQQDAELSQAFSNFAAAAGGGNTIRIVQG